MYLYTFFMLIKKIIQLIPSSYLHSFCMRDLVKDLVVDFHDLVSDTKSLLLCQTPGLHQGHIDPHSVLRPPADAKAQPLVALVSFHADLPQRPRWLVDEVSAQQRHQRSYTVTAAAEGVRRAPERHLQWKVNMQRQGLYLTFNVQSQGVYCCCRP